uniref:Uncharacterized protein n=1 Tax=Chromera velia CCMP2878 TaxID=1169474 RepID=A0A0G4ICZ4_9ALVE|eukprot:Cvel_102.t1-p1 / transcript=Cvel_102.t1 / gene=Cvel_102 / organism=Chromera_velia_CCMP2878 / gene_product=hypothetical protein / transcript_product=hypothetical protein / location=Cvel_scaffold8:85207-85659(+) / protein_length=151 / sequence_SO=supercontig / SO=protein_coding / is_pseudo=false
MGAGIAPEKAAHMTIQTGADLTPEKAAHITTRTGADLASEEAAHTTTRTGADIAPKQAAYTTARTGVDIVQATDSAHQKHEPASTPPQREAAHTSTLWGKRTTQVLPSPPQEVGHSTGLKAKGHGAQDTRETGNEAEQRNQGRDVRAMFDA